MDLDRALKLAVVSSWDELVHPDEPCSIHVEYKNLSEVPLSSVEVWMIKNRGYGTLVCRYSAARPSSLQPRLEAPAMHFANSYGSKILEANLDFVMRNQDQFSRPVDHSIHGVVQIDSPSTEDRATAATSWQCRTDSIAEPGAIARPPRS